MRASAARPETSRAKGAAWGLPCRAGSPAHWPSFRFSISEFLYFRRRRPDRHGRAQGFGRRGRVGPQQIGNPLKAGEHVLVLLGRRRRVGSANLERRVGSRWQRVGGSDRPRLDVDRGHRTGPDVGRTRLKVCADCRTGLDGLRLNVGGRCRQDAGRNRDWLWPDIGLARRHVGPMGLYVDRRRTSVGEARLDRRVSWCWTIGVDIGECGPGQGFRRFLAAKLLLGHARIGLAGKIVPEVRVASEPEALLQVLTNTIYRFKRVGLEAGPLSQWLYSVLAEAGLPVNWWNRCSLSDESFASSSASCIAACWPLSATMMCAGA
jgi:hypothetical protein